MTSGFIIDSRDLDDFLHTCKPDFAAARALGAELVIDQVKARHAALSEKLGELFTSLEALLPEHGHVKIVALPNPPGGGLVRISDGGWLVMLGIPLFDMVGAVIRIVTQGISLVNDELQLQAPTSEQRVVLGRALGHYLEIGSIYHPDSPVPSALADSLLVTSLGFIIAHEIDHALEDHSHRDDPLLTGFQDYCRIRAQEFRADQRATALITRWCGDTAQQPEIGTCGAQLALLALSWLEHYSLAPPISIVHPGADTRLLRLHLGEQSYWKANGLSAARPFLSEAVLSHALRLQEGLESNPTLLASPINSLIRSCETSADYDRFTRTVGAWFAVGDIAHVSIALGRMWGSAELYDKMDGLSIPSITVELFRRMACKLAAGKGGAISAHVRMTEARDAVLQEGVP